MGHKGLDSIQETEELNLGCATNNANLDDSCKNNHACVSETVIDVVMDTENGSNTCVSERKKEEKSLVVDVKSGDEEVLEGERICRICHLDHEQESKGSRWSKTELVRLGCGCNGELSVAHLYCAESWFKFKGNRICEICGQTVTNIRGVGNQTFMEEWVENGVNGNSSNSHETTENGCWHGQPLCNFLMACLVIAFVVPWFFHINMF